MATKDNINELISMIEQDGYNYVFALITPNEKEKNHKNIDIYSNLGENPLNKLLKILNEHKKTITRPINKKIEKQI